MVYFGYMFKYQYFCTLFVVCCLVNEMSAKKLLSVDFEVYGIVQGVFFRKYTEKQAKSLGLRGWCMNTERGTVQGAIQGEESPINNMKQWLQTTGSPSSKIDMAEFKNVKEINKYEFDNFRIRK